MTRRVEGREIHFSGGDWQSQTRPSGTPAPTDPPRGDESGSGSGAGSSTESSKGTPQGIANKEYIEREYSTLKGDCDLIPDTETIRIESGDTVNCLGLGKHMSGLYFVDEVTRRIDNSGGYSHSLKVEKNGFGDGGSSAVGGGNEPGRPPVQPKKLVSPVVPIDHRTIGVT